MFKVTAPHEMNATFARAFNSRKLENLLALYEPDARLRVDLSDRTFTGHAEIATALAGLLAAPGEMQSVNRYCIVHGDIALLRAFFTLRDGARPIASGSTAEIVRRQADGSWLYAIDHAAGADAEA